MEKSGKILENYSADLENADVCFLAVDYLCICYFLAVHDIPI